MRKKRMCGVALFIVFLMVSPLYGKETVAVLGAIVEQPIPTAARNVIADIISETIVLSDKHNVVDRTTVEKILEEQSFQVSGAVSDTKIASMGKILGADVVVIPRASRLGSRYFISAKMIDVESAEIRQQKSQELSGNEEVLFDLAAIVGKKLMGFEMEVHVSREGRVEIGKPETTGSSVGIALGYNFKVGSNAYRTRGGMSGTVEYLYQYSSRFGLGGWLGLNSFAWLDDDSSDENRYYFPSAGIKLLFLDKAQGAAASLDLGFVPGITVYYRDFQFQVRYFPDVDEHLIFSGALGLTLGYSYYISG